MIHRCINIPEKQSFFLLGARGTGKSTLLKQRFPAATTLYIDLLSAREEDRLSRNPDELSAQVRKLASGIHNVVIDEVQKVPKLLDIVHQLIESTKKRFILTGSSARKLRHGSANLLAGRAVTRQLFPFTEAELGDLFDLNEILRWGSLPQLQTFSTDIEKQDFLQAYALTYLKEEIQSEQVVRKVDPFRRFLEVAAQSNGKILNFSNIARDTGVDSKTVKSYYEILDDTLVGYLLEPFSTSVRKRLYQTPKFYFFDVGVMRALARQLTIPPVPSTTYFGTLFEQLVVLEIMRREAYRNREYRFSYLRTHDDVEIDLVIERPGRPLALVEIKSTDSIREDMLRNLSRFTVDFPKAEFFCWSRDPVAKQWGKIAALPWREGIKAI